MANGIYSSTVVTSNGTYRVGMKREEAEKNKIASCFSGIDFDDLDKDKSGVLSQKEILEGRVKQAEYNSSFVGLCTIGECIVSAFLIASGAVGEIFSCGLSTPGSVAVAGVGATIGLDAIDNTLDQNHKLSAAREELNKYLQEEKALANK